MKMDAELYKIFKSEVKSLFDLTGINAKGEYDFRAGKATKRSRTDKQSKKQLFHSDLSRFHYNLKG